MRVSGWGDGELNVMVRMWDGKLCGGESVCDSELCDAVMVSWVFSGSVVRW